MKTILSLFQQYLIDNHNPGDKIPSLSELSKTLGISKTSLREQIEVAKTIGLISAKPKTGLSYKPYSFKPAVYNSISFGIANDHELFKYYSDLRRNIESMYWYEATKKLDQNDINELYKIISTAKDKLNSKYIQIPYIEHRHFHLNIFNKINNIFVYGLLEAYWDIYEEIGLQLYSDLKYLKNVWHFHEDMVNAIEKHDYTSGRQLLINHMNLLAERNDIKINKFE